MRRNLPRNLLLVMSLSLAVWACEKSGEVEVTAETPAPTAETPAPTAETPAPTAETPATPEAVTPPSAEPAQPAAEVAAAPVAEPVQPVQPAQPVPMVQVAPGDLQIARTQQVGTPGTAPIDAAGAEQLTAAQQYQQAMGQLQLAADQTAAAAQTGAAATDQLIQQQLVPAVQAGVTATEQVIAQQVVPAVQAGVAATEQVIQEQVVPAIEAGVATTEQVIAQQVVPAIEAGVTATEQALQQDVAPALEAGVAAMEQQLAQLPTPASQPAAEPALVVPPMVAVQTGQPAVAVAPNTGLMQSLLGTMAATDYSNSAQVQTLIGVIQQTPALATQPQLQPVLSALQGSQAGLTDNPQLPPALAQLQGSLATMGLTASATGSECMRLLNCCSGASGIPMAAGLTNTSQSISVSCQMAATYGTEPLCTATIGQITTNLTSSGVAVPAQCQ